MKMIAIYKRELRAYLHSFIGALFIGATLFLMGIYFTIYNLLMGYPNMGYALSAVVILFLISIPILTMRILSEERHQKTDQLILTSPVSVGGIVLGKYLAVATVFAVPVVIIGAYPVILSFFGTVSFGESYLALAAFLFYGLTCIAVGLFISSLTESQIIAAVLSFAVLFLGYIMSGLCNIISSTGNLLTKILSAFDMVGPFNSLLNGILEVESFVYYISAIMVLLVFTVQSIQKRRFRISKNTLSLGCYSSLMLVVSIAVAILLNLIVKEIPVKYTTIDLTSQQLYSLTEQTEEILDTLEEDVTIYVVANEKQADSTLDTTLKQYDGYNSHITVSYVDPAVNPKFYTMYSDRSISSNSLIVESNKRSKVVDYNDIYEYEFDYSTYSQSVSGYDGEGQLTSAIAYVTMEDMPKIYFLEGHGELSMETEFVTAMEKENVDYETINLMDYDTVPEDAACVVVNAPTADFSEDDTEKMLSYMEEGGDVMLITTYTQEETPNYERLLEFYGVNKTKGLVIEADADHYYQDPFYLLPQIGYDSVTTNVTGNGSYIFMPYANGLLTEEKEEVTMTTLLSASEDCYVRENIAASADYSKQEEDLEGPFTLGVKCEKTVGEAVSTGIIYSSEYLFTESADAMVAGNNKKLFTGSISSLASHENSISVPVKSYDVEYITIPQGTILLLGILLIFIIPFGIMIAGFIIWFRRRKA